MSSRAASGELTGPRGDAPTRPGVCLRWLGDGGGWREALVLGLLGVAADLDFLVGRHNYETHSVGAAAIVAAAAWVMSGRDARWALAAGLAYGSHVVLDWLGSDATPPVGVMALWPFSDGFYQSSLHGFLAIWREPTRPGFVAHNLAAVVREVLVLGPLAAAAWWVRARRPPPA